MEMKTKTNMRQTHGRNMQMTVTMFSESMCEQRNGNDDVCVRAQEMMMQWRNAFGIDVQGTLPRACHIVLPYEAYV